MFGLWKIQLKMEDFLKTMERDVKRGNFPKQPWIATASTVSTSDDNRVLCMAGTNRGHERLLPAAAMKAPEGFMSTSSTLHFAWPDAEAYLATAEMCPCVPKKNKLFFQKFQQYFESETHKLKTSAGVMAEVYLFRGHSPGLLQ